MDFIVVVGFCVLFQFNVEVILLVFGPLLFLVIFILSNSANPNLYDISVRYYGQTTDQYGNNKDSMMLSYTMDRPLYDKINWSGFSYTQNDAYLCAFLREQFNTMGKADKDNRVVGCVVIPSNIRKAEDTIETSNPQFKDIPHYNY